MCADPQMRNAFEILSLRQVAQHQDLQHVSMVLLHRVEMLVLIEFVETHKIPIMKKFGWNLDLRKRMAVLPLFA